MKNVKIHGFILVAAIMTMCCWCAAADLDKVVFAAFTDTPPVIDGALADPCWQKAEIVDDFTLVNSPDVQAPMRTAFRFLYDAEKLYLAVDCWMGDTAEIVATPPEPGVKDQYTSLYSMEMFIDPQASRTNYYQFAWSVGGKRYDGFRMDAKGYDGTWTYQALILPDRWTSEVAIPLKDLKNAVPVEGAAWGFNIFRNDTANYSLWKYSGGTFHTPSLFGTMLIGSYATWWKKAFTEGTVPALARFKAENQVAIAQEAYLKALTARADALAAELQKAGAPADGISREAMQELYRKVSTLKVLVSMMEKHVQWSASVLPPAQKSVFSKFIPWR